MNKPLRNMMAIALLLAMGTLVSAHRAAAAAPKPALTIAFAGYDQIMSDLKALDELSGHTKLAAKAEAIIKSQTHGKGLAGLDKSRPWGVLVSLGENDQPRRARLSSRHRFEEAARIDSRPAARPRPPTPTGFTSCPWATRRSMSSRRARGPCSPTTRKRWTSAPADPTPALADLTKKYLLSVRGSVQNIPEASRENASRASAPSWKSRSSPCNSSPAPRRSGR